MLGRIRKPGETDAELEDDIASEDEVVLDVNKNTHAEAEGVSVGANRHLVGGFKDGDHRSVAKADLRGGRTDRQVQSLGDSLADVGLACSGVDECLKGGASDLDSDSDFGEVFTLVQGGWGLRRRRWFVDHGMDDPEGGSRCAAACGFGE